MWKAAEDGVISNVTQALDQGANVNSHNPAHQTALHVAAANGNSDVVKLLVEEYMADANCLDMVSLVTKKYLSSEITETPVISVFMHFHFPGVNNLDYLCTRDVVNYQTVLQLPLLLSFPHLLPLPLLCKSHITLQLPLLVKNFANDYVINYTIIITPVTLSVYYGLYSEIVTHIDTLTSQ